MIIFEYIYKITVWLFMVAFIYNVFFPKKVGDNNDKKRK